MARLKLSVEAFQIDGNHLKEADASAGPCDVDLAKVAPQQASAAQGAKTSLHWLLSKKTGTAAALKAIAGHYLCSALSSTFI